MPVVEFETKELLRLLKGDIDLEELGERIPQVGVGLEHLDEDSAHIEVFPNRPDMLSIEGFARALNGFLGFETGLVEYEVQPSDMILNVDSSVDGVRPFISSAVVKDIQLTDQGLKSLMDIQEKLHITHGRDRKKVAIGVHDLRKIKPDFTYKAVNPDEVEFIPLDMTEPMNMRKILSRHPKGRDYAWTLEGLEKWPLIIDGRNEVLSFPPIINGEYSRLETDTKSVFIECTGTSQLACDQAVNIIVTGLADRKGKIQSVEIKRN